MANEQHIIELLNQCSTLFANAARDLQQMKADRDMARLSHAMQQRNTEAFARENAILRAALGVVAHGGAPKEFEAIARKALDETR